MNLIELTYMYVHLHINLEDKELVSSYECSWIESQERQC